MRFSFLDLFRALFSTARDETVDYEPTPVQKLPAEVATLPDVVVEEAGVVPQWHDMRGEPRTKSRGESKGTRDWSKIKGITIHQTAVDFGTNPRRLLNVPVHGATLRDGAVVLMHDPTAYLWHGHTFNKQDIGIEVSCRAAGIEGLGSSLWLPKKYKALKGDARLEHASEATDEQLAATRELVRHYVDLVASHGGKIEFIHAHRQSSKSRVSDPGSRIWKAVGVWAIEELGLSAGPPGWKAGGMALPDVWTGEANGVRYNWKTDGRISKDNS